LEKENEVGCAMSLIYDLAAIDRISYRSRRKGYWKMTKLRQRIAGSLFFRASLSGFPSSFDIRHSIRIRTAKVFSRKIPGEDFAKKKAGELGSWRALSRRFACSTGRC
jgi:hypothetical protein